MKGTDGPPRALEAQAATEICQSHNRGSLAGRQLVSAGYFRETVQMSSPTQFGTPAIALLACLCPTHSQPRRPTIRGGSRTNLGKSQEARYYCLSLPTRPCAYSGTRSDMCRFA